jgi:hypothetical protein
MISLNACQRRITPGLEKCLEIRFLQSTSEAGIADQGDEALAQVGLVPGVGANARTEALNGIALRDSDNTGGHIGDVASLAEDAVDLGHCSGGETGDDDAVLDEHGLDWLIESDVDCCC